MLPLILRLKLTFKVLDYLGKSGLQKYPTGFPKFTIGTEPWGSKEGVKNIIHKVKGLYGLYMDLTLNYCIAFEFAAFSWSRDFNQSQSSRYLTKTLPHRAGGSFHACAPLTAT